MMRQSSIYRKTHKHQKFCILGGDGNGRENHNMVITNGLKGQVNTANTAKAGNLKAQHSQLDQGKETAQKEQSANTANDQMALLQMSSTLDTQLSDCGLQVRIWKSRDPETNEPVLMRAVYSATVCATCGGYYPVDGICGICNSNTAKK